MPVTQDRLTRLREFGLSEYAARSYLALLDLGIAEARDVSSISKVPQAKIYHVLEQLHDKGLVVILPEFPKKYAPVPFEEYLGRIYEEHTRAASAIESERAELAEMFRVMGDTEVGDRGFFTVIRGRRNVLAKIEEMIGLTQKEIIALCTVGTASRAAHLVPELERARARNVRLRFLIPVEPQTIDKLEPIRDLVELRARELGEEEQSAKVAIVVADSTRAFLIHFVPDDGNLNSGKDIGVFTDQEAMVAAIQAIVEPHWNRAATFEQRHGEILHGEMPLDPSDVGIGRLFHVLRDAVIVADGSDRISLWNPAAARMFGRDAGEAHGLPFEALLAPGERAAFTEQLRQFRARGERASEEAMVIGTLGLRQNGVPFRLEVALSGLRTLGVSQYVILVARDVSAGDRASSADAGTAVLETRLAASEERFRLAFERSPIPLAVADLDGRIVEANPAFQRGRRAVAAGSRLSDLVGSTDQPACEAAVVRLARGESATASVGSLRLSAVRGLDGRTTEIVVHARED